MSIDHRPVGNNQDRVKDLLVVRVVQIGQKMGRPCDGIGFTRTGGMLNQILLAGTFFQDSRLKFASHVQLVIARKQTPLQLFLVVAFVNQITSENFQPAFTLPDFFPQIRRHVSVGIRRVSLGSVVAFIEGQELRLRTFQPRCHADFATTHSEVNHRTTGKRQQRFRVLSLRLRVTVQPILIDRIVDALSEIGFQFDRGDRDSVQEQHQINAVLIGR